VHTCETVNDETVVNEVSGLKPDIILVFGTGLLRKPIIKSCLKGMLNFHGGDPERYRGLDSHLWAIYHREYVSLVTTLHEVNPELDDGKILLRSRLPVTKNMPLLGLRAINTEVCVNLAIASLAEYERLGHFISCPQTTKGRYYSFMPTPLKDICVHRFAHFTEQL